jgi:hypothetical protein
MSNNFKALIQCSSAIAAEFRGLGRFTRDDCVELVN